jgi:hypothetical protein
MISRFIAVLATVAIFAWCLWGIRAVYKAVDEMEKEDPLQW